MSQVKVDFIADYTDLQRKTKAAEKRLAYLQKKVKFHSNAINRSFKTMLKGVSFYALFRGLSQSVKAAAEDARSQRLLALQLRTTRNATDDQIASVEKLIGSISRAVGVTDDELRPAYAKLVRATGTTRSANKLLRIALDGAAASGKGLSTVTDALSKAYNGNFMQLYKLAPQLKASKGDIDDFAASVKGAAVASADPFARASIAFQEIQEQIGSALLPALTSMADWFTKNGPTIQKWIADLFDPKSYVGSQFKLLGDQLDKMFKRFDPNGENSLVGFFNVLNVLLVGTLQILTAITTALNTIVDLFDKNKYLTDGTIGNKVYGPGTPFQSGNANQNYITNKYNINVNQTNLTGSDLVKKIKQYETQTGLKYLNY